MTLDPIPDTKLSSLIQDVLSAASRGTLAGTPHREPDARTGDALSRVCEEAHRQQLRAEQLLILIKDQWRRRPELRSVARTDADIALADVVTLCIKQYYRSTNRN